MSIQIEMILCEFTHIKPTEAGSSPNTHIYVQPIETSLWSLLNCAILTVIRSDHKTPVCIIYFIMCTELYQQPVVYASVRLSPISAFCLPD